MSGEGDEGATAARPEAVVMVVSGIFVMVIWWRSDVALFVVADRGRAHFGVVDVRHDRDVVISFCRHQSHFS